MIVRIFIDIYGVKSYQKLAAARITNLACIIISTETFLIGSDINERLKESNHRPSGTTTYIHISFLSLKAMFALEI
jgi:hypothetical protein